MSDSDVETPSDRRPSRSKKLARPFVARLTLAAGAAAGSCASLPPAEVPQAGHAGADYRMTVTEGPPLPSGRASHAGGMVGGRVVVAGGSAWSADLATKSWLADTLVYDAGAARWLPGPSLPHACAEMMFAGDGESLYLVGGKDAGTAYADAFRIRAQSEGANGSTAGQFVVESLPPLPLALTGGGAAVLDGVLYVVGGYDSAGAMLDSVWALDVRRPDAQWRPRAAMPGPVRVYPCLTAANAALYLIGGCVVETPANPVREVFKDIYRYDPVADRWTRLADLPARGQGWVAEPVDDHHLLLTGRGDTNIYDDVWLVDLRDSRVTSAGSLVLPSFGAPLVKISAGEWWLIGGEPDANKSRTPRVSVIRKGPAAR